MSKPTIVQTKPKSVFDIADANQQLSKTAQLALWSNFNEARTLIVGAGYSFDKAGIEEYIRNCPTKSQQIHTRSLIKTALADKDKLVFSLQALVIKRAEYYKNDAISFDELCQICNLGIMKALYKFKGNKNTKFSSYAEFWIKAYVFEALYKINPIYVPAAIAKEINEFNYKYISIHGDNKDLDVTTEDQPKSTTLNDVMSKLSDTEQDMLSDAYGLEGNTSLLTVALMNGISFEEAQDRVTKTLNKARTLEVAC